MQGRQDKDKRTEKPTGKRLRKAKESGSLPRSADVSQAVALGVFLLWAFVGGGAFLSGLLALVRTGVATAALPEVRENLAQQWLSTMFRGLRLLAPLLLMLAAFAVLGVVLQGFHLRRPLFSLNLARLNPVAGLARLASVEKLIAAVKALLRTGLYALIAIVVVLPDWSRVSAMALLTPNGILRGAMGITSRVLVRALLAGIVIGVVDYAVARYRWRRGLYMTKQEVRDEAKEEENPETRARVRGKQREMTRRRMMSAVRTADVVVTNPDHVAVALKYERDAMAAPVVLAKGRGYIALRIKEEAHRHQVPIVEDPPLARALERLCRLGAPIPEGLYRAVAEVFAYVFQRRRGRYRVHTELELKPHYS